RTVRRNMRLKWAKAGSSSMASRQVIESRGCPRSSASAATRGRPPCSLLSSALSSSLARSRRYRCSGDASKRTPRARRDARRIAAVLQPLHLGHVTIDRARYLPPLLLPLVRAAARGDDIVPEVEAVVRAFGSDSFMYVTAN